MQSARESLGWGVETLQRMSPAERGPYVRFLRYSHFAKWYKEPAVKEQSSSN